MIEMKFWLPLLFIVLSAFYAGSALRDYRRGSNETTHPAFQARSRVAVIFFLVGLLLFFYL
ncbi:MAG: hypothetical protein KZQ76_07560 [Candidatus Thiodiazotropha sp. (ex Epidulcina cf. delphinae)]|nr:hypothetical protein [Candidatus Thiodiazotropha sp. (ex Epidulcina cf. delphinae)]